MGLHVGNSGKLGRRVEVAPAGGLWRATRPLHPGLRPFVRDYAGYWEAVTARRRVRMIPTPRAVVLISLGEPFMVARELIRHHFAELAAGAEHEDEEPHRP